MLLSIAGLAVPTIIFYLHHDSKDSKNFFVELQQIWHELQQIWGQIWHAQYSLPKLVQMVFKYFAVFLSANFVITLLHWWLLRNYCRCCGSDILQSVIFCLYSFAFFVCPFAWGAAFGVLYHELPEWTHMGQWDYWHEIMPIVITYGSGAGLQFIINFMIVCKFQLPCCGEDFSQAEDEERQPLRGKVTKWDGCLAAKADVENPPDAETPVWFGKKCGAADSKSKAKKDKQGGCASCCR
jgi:hypothetical protein